MTDHPVSAQERLAALEAVAVAADEFLASWKDDESTTDRDHATASMLADALDALDALDAAAMSVPAEPGAPDAAPDLREALVPAVHAMYVEGLLEPTPDTTLDEIVGRIIAALATIPMDVRRLGASISAVEDSLVRRGLMDRLTSMDNFVLAEMIAREYVASQPVPAPEPSALREARAFIEQWGTYRESCREAGVWSPADETMWTAGEPLRAALAATLQDPEP